MPIKWPIPPMAGFSGAAGLHIPAAESSSGVRNAKGDPEVISKD